MANIFAIVLVMLGFVFSISRIEERVQQTTQHLPAFFAQRVMEEHRAQAASIGTNTYATGTATPLAELTDNPAQPSPLKIYSYVVQDNQDQELITVASISDNDNRPSRDLFEISGELHKLSGGRSTSGAILLDSGRNYFIVSFHPDTHAIDPRFIDQLIIKTELTILVPPAPREIRAGLPIIRSRFGAPTSPTTP